MIVSALETAGKSVIRMEGRFTFDCHREFRDAYRTALDNPAVREVCIDLGRVEYIDSSALGMLLLLRENAVAAGKTVSLANAGGMVLEVLRLTNIDKAFGCR